MLYILNLYIAVCQVYLNKLGGDQGESTLLLQWVAVNEVKSLKLEHLTKGTESKMAAAALQLHRLNRFQSTIKYII